jgi:hypothetical protein
MVCIQLSSHPFIRENKRHVHVTAMETITKSLVGSIDLGMSVIGLTMVLLGGMGTLRR